MTDILNRNLIVVAELESYKPPIVSIQELPDLLIEHVIYVLGLLVLEILQYLILYIPEVNVNTALLIFLTRNVLGLIVNASY